jgi:eukaryotic-like serine/threonine-protein kinase
MSNNRLQRVLAIVEKALSLQREERARYLDEACGGDTGLKTEITNILDAAGETDSFWNDLQEWSRGQLEDIFSDTAPTEPESEIRYVGPWRLVKPIGSGGMGIVYLAERADGSYNQLVALKLLRNMSVPGESEPSSSHRFRQERQILARLDHPSIARLYDGGHTDEGIPWLAMEYVNGLPITEWCRRNTCSLQERLDLFKKVCEAIRYAHKNLIVHRDLKPENILVTGDGEVKILDFGIAKLLDDEFSDTQHILTQTGVRALSLNYAAPEQITGEPITTATDVYTLGLLLYELIAGVYPFDLHRLTVRQIEQVIRNDEPAKPSIALNRDLTVAEEHEIRGDLDSITMKALRKEPEQRYENAGHLLDDIIRHQNNHPVSARRDTVQYRLDKFIRRHRRSMAAIIIVCAVLIGMTMYYTRQLAHERDVARIEAARAEQVSAFLTDLFSSPDPSEARGRNITARELLERGAGRINELTDQPEVRAAMLQLIGRVYWSMGDYEEAVPILEQAIELQQVLSDDASPARAITHFTLGVVLHDMGDYRRAVPHFEKAVGIFRMNPDLVSSEYAASLEKMGYVEDALRNYVRAEELHREALEMRMTMFGPDHPDVAQSHYSIAILRSHQGDMDGAIAGQREALRIFHLNNMVDTRFGARILNHLGRTLIRTGEFDEAEEYLIKALQINRRIHGDTHLETGRAKWALATLYHARGEYDSAGRWYKETLAVLRAALGDNHVMVGQILQEYGDIYRLSTHQDFIKAEQIFRSSLEIFESAERVHPERLIVSRRKLGATLTELGRFEQAEELLLESLAESQRISVENQEHGHLVERVFQDLVNLYSMWGRVDAAAAYGEQLSEYSGR